MIFKKTFLFLVVISMSSVYASNLISHNEPKSTPNTNPLNTSPRITYTTAQLLALNTRPHICDSSCHHPHFSWCQSIIVPHKAKK